MVPVVLAAGAKEIADAGDPEHHSAEWLDFVATVAGGGLGVEIGARTFVGLAVVPEPGGGAVALVSITLRR